MIPSRLSLSPLSFTAPDKDLLVFDLDLTLIQSQELRFKQSTTWTELLDYYRKEKVLVVNYNFKNPENFVNTKNFDLNKGIIFVKNESIYQVFFRPYLRELLKKLLSLRKMSKNVMIVAATMGQPWYAKVIVSLIENYFADGDRIFEKIYSNKNWEHRYGDKKIKNVDYILDDLRLNQRIEITNAYIFDDQINIWFFSEEKKKEYNTIVHPVPIQGWDFRLFNDKTLKEVIINLVIELSEKHQHYYFVDYQIKKKKKQQNYINSMLKNSDFFSPEKSLSNSNSNSNSNFKINYS